MTTFASATINSSAIGTALQSVLSAKDIEPGSSPSYETCKVIFLFHPVGQKMAEAPIKMAMRMPRLLKVGDGPEEELIDAFLAQERRDGVYENIKTMCTLARVYGNASMAVLEEKVDPDKPMNFDKIAEANISFNIFDPLNTAGSLVLDQNPNSLTFQKHIGIMVAGRPYDRSRSVTLLNEQPIYISYTDSAFGFNGRSVYQRALYPLKSFINTMVADDMVARKSGLIVASLKMASSIVDNIMNAAAGFKRRLLKVGETDNVLSIGLEEKIESINLQNLEGPLSVARKNIIENIATAADMPAKILLQETFAEGFGEGTEDANYVADYLDGMRVWMEPVWRFCDKVTMYRAWNKNFYNSLVDKYGKKEIGGDYTEAFYRWKNSFEASWPSLKRESEAVRVQLEETKLQAALITLQMLLPMSDPENKAKLVEWLELNINNSKNLFTNELQLDIAALVEYAEQNQMMEEQAAVEGERGGAERGMGMGQKRIGNLTKNDNMIAAYINRPTNPSEQEQTQARIARIEDYLSKHKRLVR